MSNLVQQRWIRNSEKQEIVDIKTSNAREKKYRKQIEEKNAIIFNLRKKIGECNFFIQNIDGIKEQYPFIYYLFQTACNKLGRKGKMLNGMRYSIFLIPYILILALFGKKVSLFLHITLGFPVWSTIIRWRKKFISKYKICLDGTPESIQNMVDSYLGEIDDKRVVLAIDAASVSARVSVSSNGEVKGLLNTKWINNPNEVLSTPYEFSTFVSSHEHEIIRYFFVVHICPLCPSAKSFPIALIPKCSGNANKEIVENFKKIVENVKKIVNVVGVAFDGDSGWLHLAKHSATTTKNLILQSLLKNEKIFSLDKYVILYDDKNIDQLPFLIFEDLLHLVKCFRYRLISGCGICPSVYSDENNFISNENFQTVGIPPWILDNAKYLKMDDGLPLKLFTFENIQKCILKDRYDLAYSLIPCTLLINSIMNDELDRTARIEMLSIGYSIVFLYLNELEKYSNFKKDRKQKTSKNGGKCMHLTLMDKKWCAKYLSLCASLVYVLNDCHAVDLGSLGSHKLEHFFGKVRQFARGNKKLGYK